MTDRQKCAQCGRSENAPVHEGLRGIQNHAFVPTPDTPTDRTQKGKSMDINCATTATDEDVKEVFDYHPWSPEQIQRGNAVRVALGAAFKAVIENVPPSPDRTVALRKIREARMDANSAITHNGRY